MNPEAARRAPRGLVATNPIPSGESILRFEEFHETNADRDEREHHPLDEFPDPSTNRRQAGEEVVNQHRDSSCAVLNYIDASFGHSQQRPTAE